MSRITRSQASSTTTDALNHVRCSIFGEPLDSGPLFMAFTFLQVRTITDFMALEKEDLMLDALQADDDNGPSAALAPIVIWKLLKL